VRIDSADRVCFRLHQTDVVTYYPDGTILLDVYASTTTDSFANALLDSSIRTSFKGGYVEVDGLAYLAIDYVTIHPDRSVTTCKPWSKYRVNRKLMNAAIREHAPSLLEAAAWLKAAEALRAIPLDSYDFTAFSGYHSLETRLERLEDRKFWPCLTEHNLNAIREGLAKRYALEETDPVDGIPANEISGYRQAWRKWGQP
jgi:hypothetical protein